MACPRESHITNAVRTGGPNGAADAAYSFGYRYDPIGNRLLERRGPLGLQGALGVGLWGSRL
jgi:hypothetical protein